MEESTSTLNTHKWWAYSLSKKMPRLLPGDIGVGGEDGVWVHTHLLPTLLHRGVHVPLHQLCPIFQFVVLGPGGWQEEFEKNTPKLLPWWFIIHSNNH